MLAVSHVSDIEETYRTTSILGQSGHHCIVTVTNPDQALTGSALTTFVGDRTLHASVQGGVVSTQFGSWKYGKAASGLVAALNDLGGSAFPTKAAPAVKPPQAGQGQAPTTAKPSTTEKIKSAVGVSAGGISLPAAFSTGVNSNYATQLVPSTTELLQKLGLQNVDLYVQNLPQEANCGSSVGESVKIWWKQNLQTREEVYRKVHYTTIPSTAPAPATSDPAGGDDGAVVKLPVPSPILVYVADVCGSPPARFNTKGVSLGTGNNMGKLFCGYVYLDQADNQGLGAGALFFVIHPPTWKPFQKRFYTSALTALVGTGIQAAADHGGSLAGAAIGAAVGSVVPGLGNLVGAAVGYGVGYLLQHAVDAGVGDNLRYIGDASGK
mmetsp:Transcript_124180/g.215243  ORF Transcript_124180/g.215243 Transcript_124180/m.215243 type:complete len:381 (-) Transcript_124180:107-1249(-)